MARIAAGGTYVWNNNGSDFTAAANWSPSGGPTSNDQALFDPESSPPGTAVVNPTVNGHAGFDRGITGSSETKLSNKVHLNDTGTI
jgi:hypothetical protein